MSTVTFADVVHQAITFSETDRTEALILSLIDTPWVQRLRDVSQTASTNLVYMYSEHSRFGHSLGVAYLASELTKRLEIEFPEQVAPFRTAVVVAALLHDIGHLAPGSHTAFKVWFPKAQDSHESIAVRIIREDREIAKLLGEFSSTLADQVVAILEESPDLPPWTWQILSGGGWNVDRGNWCIADSILCGVTYGRYNIPALVGALTLAKDGSLILEESRLDAMVHFSVSRLAMYKQVYLHRVLLAADALLGAVVTRIRDIADGSMLSKACDDEMLQVIKAHSPETLPLETICTMRECWWRYHLMQWRRSSDSILSDLADRVINRRLFKTVRIREHEDAQVLIKDAQSAVTESGFDPRYYLHKTTTSLALDSHESRSMGVRMDDGSIKPLTQADPLFSALSDTLLDGDAESKTASRTGLRSWLALPQEAKLKLGRNR